MAIYWFTGQPGAGKTTLAKFLYNGFTKFKCVHIDGDDIREIFDNKDYSETGRRTNIEKAQDIALFLHKKGYTVIVSLVSPYKDQREAFKKKCDVIEIYVHTSEKRGKEHFRVENYEEPTENYINIDTTNSTESNSFQELLFKLKII